MPRKPSQPREVFNATVSSGAATGVPQPSRFHRHWPSCRMIALCYVVLISLRYCLYCPVRRPRVRSLGLAGCSRFASLCPFPHFRTQASWSAPFDFVIPSPFLSNRFVLPLLLYVLLHASLLPLDRSWIDLSSRARQSSSLRLVPSVPTLQDQNPAVTIAVSLSIPYLSPFDPLCTAVLLVILAAVLRC